MKKKMFHIKRNPFCCTCPY